MHIKVQIYNTFLHMIMNKKCKIKTKKQAHDYHPQESSSLEYKAL